MVCKAIVSTRLPIRRGLSEVEAAVYLSVSASFFRRLVDAPLVALLRDTLLKPKEVAARWGQSEDHLASLRRSRRGLLFIRLPGAKTGKGSIRYRLSDLIAAELADGGRPLSFERVCLPIASCPDVPKEMRARILAHVRQALAERE